MAQLSFLADEHVKRSYVHALRAHGFDVVAVAEGAETGERDAVHLERSSQQNLVVLTNDDDFVRLAQQRSVRFTRLNRTHNELEARLAGLPEYAFCL